MVNEETLKKRVEILAHIVTVSAIAIYVCGFVVLSVQHASLGLPQVNLLRPRILSAGVLLIVFAGIPTLGMFQIGEVREFLTGNHAVKDRFRATVRLGPVAIMALAVLAFLFRQLLVGSPGTHDFRGFLGLALSIGLITALEVWFPPVWVRRLIITVSVAWLIFCVYLTMDKTLYILLGWFSWCAFTTVQTYGALKRPEELWTVNLFQTIVGTVITFGFFAVYVYPRIPAIRGGGEAIPATLSFVLQDKQPPVGTTQQLKVWMVDETDTGFYFLQSKESKKAVFVPRNEVSAIFFGE